MGFDVLQTTLLGIPSDFIQGISLLLAGYVATRFPNTRILVMTICNIACIIASACMAYLPLANQWGRLVAFWFTSLQRYRKIFLRSDLASEVLFPVLAFPWDWLWSASTWAVVSAVKTCQAH